MIALIVRGCVGLAAGVVVNALPDRGESIVSLGSEHGLSGQDLAGVALLLAGWLLVAREIWVRRGRVVAGLDPPERIVSAFAVGAGIGLLFASLFNEWPWWWLIAAALLGGVQLRAALLAFR